MQEPPKELLREPPREPPRALLGQFRVAVPSCSLPFFSAFTGEENWEDEESGAMDNGVVYEIASNTSNLILP